MPSKKALLVGCNYPGTNAELRGCINDVIGAKAMLTTYFGFAEADITTLIDTDPNSLQPTGKNIKAKLSELVANAQDNDVIVFHFSGHGTQIPSDNVGDESDGKDEAICPCDMNVITDDDLRALLAPLSAKPTVKFTFIADCCHSGTILDHPSVIITGPKAGGPPPPPVDIAAIQSMLASLGAGGGAGTGPAREMKNRALPTNQLFEMLSSMLGQPVNQGNARSAMGSIFGADASVKVQQFMKYAQMAQKALATMQAKQGTGAAAGSTPKADPGIMGIVMQLLGACMGGGAAAGAAAGPGAAYALPGTDKPPAAGSKPPAGQQLSEDVGILISGCQDKETSADACPSGDPAKAHGALSNAMQTVVKQHFEKQPNVQLTYRNVVVSVREMLAKTGFTQNPCLECASKYADTTFILQ